MTKGQNHEIHISWQSYNSMIVKENILVY